MTETNNNRAGQCREVDHELGIELFLCVPQYIRQDEATLGVGIDHFDRLARVTPDNIAWALRGARRHVLNEADQTDRVDLRLAARERGHQTNYGAGTGHVP